MQNVQMFTGLMTALNPDWKKDTRLCLQLEDSMKNAYFTPGQAHITNGEAQVLPTRSISIGQLVQEMGLCLKHGESIDIGKLPRKITSSSMVSRPLYTVSGSTDKRYLCARTLSATARWSRTQFENTSPHICAEFDYTQKKSIPAYVASVLGIRFHQRGLQEQWDVCMSGMGPLEQGPIQIQTECECGLPTWPAKKDQKTDSSDDDG